MPVGAARGNWHEVCRPMQTVNFNCPHCGNLMAVSMNLLGRNVRCPHCKQVLRAPAAAGGVSAPPQPAAPTPSPPAPVPTFNVPRPARARQSRPAFHRATAGSRAAVRNRSEKAVAPAGFRWCWS